MTHQRIATASGLLFQLLAVTLAAQQPTPTREQLGADATRSNLTETARKMSAQNDAVGAWLAFFTLAGLEEASGRTAEAIGYVEKALAVINDAKVSTVPFSLETLFTLWDSGLPRSMLDFYKPHAEWMKPMVLEGMLEPITRDSYGNLLMNIGQLEKAEAELTKAAECLRNSPVKYAAVDAHLGDLRFRQKRYDEARAHYRSGLEALSQMSMNPMADPLTKLWFYDRLARVETSTGQPEEAKRWSDKALEIARLSRMPPQEAVTPKTDRELPAPGGRLPDTEAALMDALNVIKATNDAAEQAGLEFRLGKLEILNGNYGSAASHLERSVQLYESLTDPMSEMAAWESLCIVYLHTTNYAAMENALARAHSASEWANPQSSTTPLRGSRLGCNTRRARPQSKTSKPSRSG